jgi:hypothetical protein
MHWRVYLMVADVIRRWPGRYTIRKHRLHMRLCNLAERSLPRKS